MDFDRLFATEAFTQDPYSVYRQLRREAPVFRSQRWNCWVVSRHAEASEVLSAPETFSNFGRVTNVISREFPDDFLKQISALLHHFSKGLINVDPPDHTRLRRLLQKAFLPRTLEALKPRITAAALEIVASWKKGSVVDLAGELAFPIPVAVIAELMGVPGSMREQFRQWSTTILEFQNIPKPDRATVLASQSAIMEMRGYLKSVTSERRKSSGNDLLSEMVKAEEAGDRLTEDELLSMGVSLLIAGHETTTSLISTGAMLFASQRELLERVKADRSLIGPFIEECLRWESPLQRLGRTAVSETQLGEARIHAGETVFIFLGSANRDETVFEDPDGFKLGRTSGRHLAFGHGIHFCLGAALARLEAPIVFNTLLDHAIFEPAWETLRWKSGVIRSLRELPIKIC